MKKKMVALLLMATMLAGIFAGCGQSGEQENEEEQVVENGEQQEEEQGGSAQEEDHDPVTLHYYFGSYAEQEDAQKVFAYANELIQEIYPWITVEFHVSATADYPTHMALAQANGDQIDIIGSYGLDYQVEMSNGSFMDITEYLSNYPDLMSALPDFAYGYGQKDGKTYGIPNWQQSNYANAAFAIEKETADALGFDVDKMNEVIQSQEFLNPEVYTMIGDFLAAARAAGRDDVIFNPGGNSIGAQARGYEQVTGPIYYAWADDSCTLVNIWETEGVTDYLKALYEYKEAGYIPADYYENRNAYQGKPGVDAGYTSFYYNDNAYVPNFPELRLNNWGVDLYFMQTQKSEDEYYIGYTNAAGLTCVSATSQYPEDALRIIELMYTNEEIQNTLVYGLEGEHYTKNDDGTIHTIEYDSGQAAASNSYGMYKWALGNSGLTWINQSFDEEFKTWAFETLPETATPSNLIGFSPDTSKINSQISQVNAVVTEYQQQLLWAGCTDWEATYAEFMEKLDAAGINTVIEVLQAQVDAFLASK